MLESLPDSRAGREGTALPKDRVTPDILAKIRALGELAAARGQSIAQMALAWVLRGGRVLLDGRWPEADPLAVAVAGLLRSAGMEIDFSGGRVSAMAAGVRSIPVLDCAGRADLLPLAAALAASGSGEVRLINLPDDAEAPEALEAMHELLSRHERLASEDGEYLVIGPAGPDIDRERGPWAAPEPTWIMAAALAALHRSGLMLANPGDLSGLWPGFWTLYTSLFGGTAERAEPEEPEDDDRPKGRRIRL